MQNTPRSKKFGEEPTADADKEKYGGGAPVTLDMMSGLTLNGLSYMMASDQQEGWEDKLVEPGGGHQSYVYTAMYLAPVTVSACSTPLLHGHAPSPRPVRALAPTFLLTSLRPSPAQIASFAEVDYYGMTGCKSSKLCIKPHGKWPHLTKLTFKDRTNGIEFAIQCKLDEQNPVINGVPVNEQWGHPHLQRVVKGWEAACGTSEETSIIGELKKMQALSSLLSPSAWLSMPDPALLIDIYQGVVDYGVNTGALEKKDLETLSTTSSDSWSTQESTKTVDDVDTDSETTTEKTAFAIDGDAGTTISTKLAEVAGNDAMTQQVMGVLGGIADCGAAVAGAVVSGGAGTGGAIAACGKLIAGGAWLTPSRHAAVPACAPCLLRANK